MNIILCGACGKMGKNVAELASGYGAEIVCGVDLFPSPMPFPVYRIFSEVKEQADAVVDISSAERHTQRQQICKELQTMQGKSRFSKRGIFPSG